MQQNNSSESKETTQYTDKFGNDIQVSPNTTEEEDVLSLTKNGLMSLTVTAKHFERLLALGTLIAVEQNKEGTDQLSA